MKYNKSNIITDKDIIFTTSKNEQYTLGETLEKHQEQIDDLKSNVKWMYKYGALGNGAGGGGGSSESTYTVLIYKGDGELIKSGMTLNYSSTGSYPIRVQILKGGISTYNVTFSWIVLNKNGEKQTMKITNRATPDNGFSVTEYLNFTHNDTLKITIEDNNNPEDYYTENGSPVLSFPYIVEAYLFKSYFVLGNDTTETEKLQPYENDSNSIFMSAVKEYGLMLAFEYSIAIAINESESMFSYVDFLGQKHIFRGEDSRIHKGSNILYFELAPDICDYLSHNENASYKRVDVEASITLESTINPEPLYSNSIKNNLIPDGLYLKVTTDGGTIIPSNVSTDDDEEIFNTINEIPEDEQFTPGDIIFTVTPYYGSLIPGRKFKVNAKVYNVDENGVVDDSADYETGYVEIYDQSSVSQYVQCNIGGVKKVIFTIQYGNEVSTYEYWMNVRILESNFNWYPNNITPISASYYRNGFVSDGINTIQKNDLIEFNINTSIKSYTFDNKNNNAPNRPNIKDDNNLTNVIDFMANIGIQYSKINDYDKPIFSINAPGSTEREIEANSIFVFQDKIIITTDKSIIRNNNVTLGTIGNTFEIFIPLCDLLDTTNKDNYHLFSLYKRLESISGNNYNRSILAFIDGCLDGISEAFTTINSIYDSITFYPGNYIVNTIDISWWKHGANDTTKAYLEDNEVSCFWYTYNIRMKNSTGFDYDEDTIKLYNTVVSNFEIDNENYIHYSNDSVPSNIATSINIPVMVMYFDDVNGDIGGGVNGWNKDNFRDFINEQYGEEQTGIPEKIPVKIKYSEGHSELKDITINGSPAEFRVDLQGSSTRTFRCKNFELYAPYHTDKDNFVYIYSPNNNNDPNNTTAFLPEESFTLKADVVDSSHTNNNAMGEFINENTRPFADAIASQGTGANKSIYANRLKNCLIGYPILLFLHTKYYKDAHRLDAEAQEGRYFLGIYNFNLGRNSAFNMGYKNIKVLDNILQNSQNGFQIFELSTMNNTLLPNIEVAEIQGNGPHFDFSQYDQSVLFQLPNVGDKTYMWGDFIHDPAYINENTFKTNISKFCERIAFAGGYMFKKINKIFSDDPTTEYGYADKYSKVDNEGNPVKQVPNFLYKYTRKKTDDGQVVSTYNIMDNIPTIESLQNNAINTIFDYTDEDGARNIPAVDFRSLAEYYVTCMAFALTDSVQKNLNIKSWNSEDIKKWYLAFYDMDTCLGINNSGGRINYFAFSDYWNSVVTKDTNNKNVLQAVQITRDWAPVSGNSNGSFFDVPSSYLFAVAKYAYNILYPALENGSMKSLVEGIEADDPSNIWGVWRKKEGSDSTRGQGCLRNADYFVNKYFISHTKDIPEIIFNINFRYKYLKKNISVSNPIPTAWENYNFSKFHGRKLAYTKYWIDGRLHILDGYFNVSQCPDNLTADIKAPMVTKNMYQPLDNPDVYLLHEIFSDGNKGLQYDESSAGELPLVSRPFTPIHIQGANTDSARYLFPNTSEECKIYISVHGQQTTLFGGSAQWTDCQTINQFITLGQSLTIKSDYLQNIIGTARTCKLWNIENCTAVKRIVLKSEGYSGEIVIRPREENNFNKFTNLTEIDISNTLINLEIDNVPVKILKATNKPGGILNMSNLNSLDELEISGKFSKLSVVSWKQGCSLPTSSNASLECSEIKITNNRDRFLNNSVVISNNSILEKVEIDGFVDIEISNCPMLKEIHISNCADLRRIVVNMPVGVARKNDTPLSLYYDGTPEPGIIDLSKFTSLECIGFGNCLITEIIIPNGCNIELPAGAFSLSSNLENITIQKEQEDELTTKLFLTGPSTFQNCYKLDYTDLPIHVKFGTDSLAYSFSCNGTQKGKMTYDDVNAFFNRIIDDIKKVQKTDGTDIWRPPTMYVTNIRDMFRNQNIIYGLGKGLEEYNNHECSLRFHVFLRCLSLDDALQGNQIEFLNRYMMCQEYTIQTDPEDSSVTINETYRLGHTLVNQSGFAIKKALEVVDFANVYTTIDLIDDLLDKINGINFRNTTLSFISSDGIGIQQLKLNDFFTASNTKENYISSLNYFAVAGSVNTNNTPITVEFDFSELFNSPKYEYGENNTAGNIISGEYGNKWTEASRGLQFYEFMNGSYRVDSLNNVNYLLSKCKLIENVWASFGGFVPRYATEYNALDIYNFIDWNNINSVKILFHSDKLYNGQSHGTSSGLNMKKFVTYSHLQDIMWDIVNAEQLEYVGALFNNCTVIMNNASDEFTLINRNKYNNLPENDTLKSIGGLFTDMKVVEPGSTKSQPIYIRQDFMRPLKNVISFCRTFANWYFKYPLPFDFFNKRIEIRSTDGLSNYCGKIENGTRYGTNVTKITYEYKNDIIDLMECFRNIKFEKARSFKINGIYDGSSNINNVNGTLPGRNTFTYKLSSETFTTDTVYDNNNNPVTIEESYEITDAINAEVEGYSILDYTNDIETNKNVNVNIDNSSMYITNIDPKYIDTSGCFISPDILYAVSSGCYFNDFISRTESYENLDYYTFTGTIPPHMMNAIKNRSFGGMFNGLNIVPIHRPEFDTISEEQNMLYYVYVPDNFSTASEFENAFNFNVIFPRHTENYNEFFALLTDKSLPNMTRLNGATFSMNRFDISGQILNGAESLPEVHKDDSGIRYNIMISIDNENNIIYGIPAKKFPYMRYDNILNSWQAFIFYGHLIYGDNGGWTSKKLYSNGSYVFAVSSLEQRFSTILNISKNLKLNAKNDNDHYISMGGAVTVNIHIDSLLNCSNPEAWVEAYTNRFRIYVPPTPSEP